MRIVLFGESVQTMLSLDDQLPQFHLVGKKELFNRENFPNADHHWGNTFSWRMEMVNFFEELIHQTEFATLHKIRDIYF